MEWTDDSFELKMNQLKYILEQDKVKPNLI